MICERDDWQVFTGEAAIVGYWGFKGAGEGMIIDRDRACPFLDEARGALEVVPDNLPDGIGRMIIENALSAT